MADQKTEQPTQKRQKEAREQGRFPVSRELVTGVQFYLFVWLLTRRANDWMFAFEGAMRRLLTAAFAGLTTAGDVQALSAAMAAPFLFPLLKTGAILSAGSLALHLLSTQFGFALSKLAPDFSRLNGLPRLAQLPKQNAGQAFHALIALPVFAGLTYYLVTRHLADFNRLPAAGIRVASGRVASALSEVLWDGAALLLLLGLADYYRQRSSWQSQMKMSKQEVQDEHKESEGNPQMKARVRRLMRSRSRRQMMKDVETATAVVVNPTHFAIALRYDAGEMPAPKVVAKGKNFLAARIRERALKNQVPIVENPPLARALYQSAEVGQEIPAALFRAVAEVLAYIYRVTDPRARSRR